MRTATPDTRRALRQAIGDEVACMNMCAMVQYEQNLSCRTYKAIVTFDAPSLTCPARLLSAGVS